MDLNFNIILLIILAVILIVILIRFFSLKKTLDQKETELDEKSSQFNIYKKKMEPLKKYLSIVDAEKEADRLRTEAKTLRDTAKFDYEIEIAKTKQLTETMLNESKQKVKEIRLNADNKLKEAYELANKIEMDARTKAQEISGSAWEAKENAEQYEATVQAMKNIISI